MKNHSFLYAMSTLIGMIVGVGIFGIPYAVAQTGLAIGFFYLAGLGMVVVILHLFYGEIILRTEAPHRLVGYAELYLGRQAKILATLTIFIEYYGALLAYIIVGGQFLYVIFGRWLDGSEFWGAMVFFIFGAAAILAGLRAVAKSEFFMTGLLLLTVGILITRGFPLIDVKNFIASDMSKFFLPYGVIFFSLIGASAIPEMRQILRGEEKKLRPAILLGTIAPVVIYFLFALTIVGISGPRTSREAILGLAPYVGSWVVNLGAFFGVLAAFTSFICLGLSLKRVFQYDWRVKEFWAFALACFIPLLAYVLGLKDFIFIIGFVGAVAVGFDGILTVLIYFKAKKRGDRKPEYSLPPSLILGFLLILIFGLGIIYQFVYLAK